MATPTQPERRLLAVGAKKGTAWGTAVALGALNGALVNSLSGFNFAKDYDPANEADTPFVRSGNLTLTKPVDFTLGFDMRYNPGILGTLMALLFGTAGAPTDLTGAYKHKLQWADSQYGKFAVVAAEFPSKIYEVASAKITEFTLKVNKGLLTGELKLRGNTLINTSAVNTLTQMDALTYADRENRILYAQGFVKMNEQSGAAVTAATALECNSIEVSYKRSGHDAVYSAGSATIIEPVEGGHPEIRVKLGFPRMNTVNDAFMATFIAETTQKMLIKFTGALITGANYYDLALYFPRLRMAHPEYGWSEIINAGLELVAEEAAANPTGMDYTRPYIELINTQTTDFLA
jgi:hypothetical protein